MYKFISSLFLAQICLLANMAWAAGMEEDVTDYLDKLVGKNMHGWIKLEFDLGIDGDDSRVRADGHWRVQEELTKSRFIRKESWQDEDIKLEEAADARREAECEIKRQQGQMCIALKKHRVGNNGWHARFVARNPIDFPWLWKKSNDGEYGNYELGKIESLRVLSTELSSDSKCDVKAKTRYWLKPTLVGTAIQTATNKDGIDQIGCFRIERNGVKAIWTTTLME